MSWGVLVVLLGCDIHPQMPGRGGGLFWTLRCLLAVLRYKPPPGVPCSSSLLCSIRPLKRHYYAANMAFWVEALLGTSHPRLRSKVQPECLKYSILQTPYSIKTKLQYTHQSFCASSKIAEFWASPKTQAKNALVKIIELKILSLWPN